MSAIVSYMPSHSIRQSIHMLQVADDAPVVQYLSFLGDHVGATVDLAFIRESLGWKVGQSDLVVELLCERGMTVMTWRGIRITPEGVRVLRVRARRAA